MDFSLNTRIEKLIQRGASVCFSLINSTGQYETRACLLSPMKCFKERGRTMEEAFNAMEDKLVIELDNRSVIR